MIDLSIAKSIFLRKGKEGVYTKLAHGLPLPFQTHLDDGESPFVFSQLPSSQFFVLTDRRALWGDNEGYQFLLNSELDDVIVDLDNSMRRGKNKEEMDELLLVDRSGRKHAITVESGAPFFGLWNVLRYVAQQNSRSASTE